MLTRNATISQKKTGYFSKQVMKLKIVPATSLFHADLYEACSLHAFVTVVEERSKCPVTFAPEFGNRLEGKIPNIAESQTPIIQSGQHSKHARPCYFA